MAIIHLKNIKRSFHSQGSREILVLDQVNLSIKEGEIVALLGKSGSGKSTLLRIIAGLIAPTEGEVLYYGQPMFSPVNGLSMVFQDFALLPWLTVLENVELGLEAQKVPAVQRRKRALSAIDRVGLDGFESAYPKELSGGMCQRVGIARALVVEPKLLLMDEPSSALDVLTAENLRADLLNILHAEDSKIKSALIVTHNIEEAVLLADRIVLLSANPGSVRSEIRVSLPRPRYEKSPRLRALVDRIYTLMTKSMGESQTHKVRKAVDLGYRLPDIAISELIGLVETLGSEEFTGRTGLPHVAEAYHLEVDDLFPLVEVLELLHFAQVLEGGIELTGQGQLLAHADILEKKKLFASHLLEYVPLVKHIRSVLDARPDHKEKADFFLEELEEYFMEDAARETLKEVIDWGRYAELFAYDVNTEMLSLENPI